jgi:hypothetical protein
MTKLASSLPKGEANGLSALAAVLVDIPEHVHVVIALVDCKRIQTDVDSGDVEPTARIRRIEAVLPEDHAHAHRMILRSLEKRTGKTVLPFDLEQDLRTAFGGIDPTTGEKHGDDDGT